MDYQPLSRSIVGRVAIVTGAASGMGRATAHLFAREGAKVVVSDLTQEGCEAVCEEIAKARMEIPSIGEAIPVACDVGDPDALKALAQAAVERFGGVDILVNNAGFARHAMPDQDEYDEVWQRSLAVMLSAHQRLIRACLPHLRRSDAPRIVNIASTEGLGATPGNASYVAAKHGVIGLTRAMAVDLGPEGITCNAICPGPIRTAITEGISEEHKTIFAKRRTALKRYGAPEEVANMTLSLVLPAASFITGAAIPVDGGLTIRNA